MPSIPLPDPPLADDAVELDRFGARDVPVLVEACNDAEIARFTFIPAPYRRRDAEEFVAGQESRRANGEAIDLAIREAGTGELLGATGLRAFRWSDEVGEIGYWVQPAARGRGVAPRAVDMLSEWALRTLPLRRVDLTPEVENKASRRVAEKAGFSLRPGRRRTFAKGRQWELLVYSRELRGEDTFT